MSVESDPNNVNSDRPNDDPEVARWGAFSYPNYRRYWFASLARVFGIQFRFLGAGWLVAVELDESPFWLGLVMLASAVPTIVLSVPAGVLADRLDTRRLLLISQVLSFGAHLALAILVVTDVVQLWIVIVWAIVSGAFTALSTPAQNAILPRLIEMRVMASAVAFNSSIWNSMRIVGPALGGILIAAIGTGQAFFVTAGGFAISIVLIASLQLAPQIRDLPHGGDRGLSEGFRYILSRPIFFATIGLSFFTSIFGTSYVVLLPIFADDLLDVGARGFGFMEAAAGIGGLLGTVLIVKLGGRGREGPVMLGSAAIFGIWIALFAATESFPLAMLLLFAGGLFEAIYLNLGMTTIQLLVPNHLRGRVMGIWTMTWFLTSVGGFVAGAVAEALGVRLTIAAGALAVTGFALLLLVLVPELRRLGEARAQVDEGSPERVASD